ncbi:hypothetical protein L596_013915 [Steinernema carpocapsae]|uniref:Follistatin-like domain-containing protein n=1 Tax=Steinernema carpocapsae TaxID=34508 RepID=A0A4V6A5B3_STECR|nr:hypothetical protein L596_013915 [Steinernema carpocapsae]
MFKFYGIVLACLVAVALGGPVDVPHSCDKHKCPAGEHCELTPVQCIREPCYPVPTCHADQLIDEPHTCDKHQCPEGKHCELTPIQCIRAPCYPVPNCYDD